MDRRDVAWKEVQAENPDITEAAVFGTLDNPIANSVANQARAVLQANPTIIGDNCFIGARSEIVEGVIVGEGSVVAMGVFITQSTKIVYRDTGEVIRGHIPPYSVVVPGTMPGKDGGPGLACAVIVKTVDAQTREKTGINDLLRD